MIDRSMEVINDIPQFNPSMLPTSIEEYTYIDLKSNIKHNFMRDYSNKKEIIFENDKVVSPSELRKLNVFNSIAAGNPILLNSTVDCEFYFPNQWLSPNNDYYMVKVKGDSMINANINDGDMVVIKHQNTATIMI